MGPVTDFEGSIDPSFYIRADLKRIRTSFILADSVSSLEEQHLVKLGPYVQPPYVSRSLTD
jgi:hypothetical protein